MPEGAVVVNAARGQLLDLDALVKALDNGPVAAAGPWMSSIPNPSHRGHPVLTHEKIVLSPHIAGMSVEATNRLAPFRRRSDHHRAWRSVAQVPAKPRSLGGT